MSYTPFKRSSWLDELAQRVGYMLAGRANSMFARRLLDVCSMFAMLCACFIFARCLLDVCSTFARRLLMFSRCLLFLTHASYLLDVCSMFAGRLLDVCSMSSRCLLDRVNGALDAVDHRKRLIKARGAPFTNSFWHPVTLAFGVLNWKLGWLLLSR